MRGLDDDARRAWAVGEGDAVDRQVRGCRRHRHAKRHRREKRQKHTPTERAGKPRQACGTVAAASGAAQGPVVFVAPPRTQREAKVMNVAEILRNSQGVVGSVCS